MNKKLFMSLAIGALLTSQMLAKPVLINSQIRLTFQVAKEGLNRIKILDDRIESIYGDDHAFVGEADAKTGQFFFRVRPDHNDKPIFLTLLTEEGLDQDLKLIPTKTAAKTITLKPQDFESEVDTSFAQTGEGDKPPEGRVEVMRKLVTGSLKGQPCSCCGSDNKRPHSQFKNCQMIRLAGRRAHALYFIVKNDTDKDLNLKEDHFFKEGDQAIAIGKSVLQPGAQTDLFILKVGGCNG